LSNFDWRFALGIDRIQPCEVRPALVDRHRFGQAVLGDSSFEVAPGSGLVPLGAEQEIDCVTGFIDGSVKVLI
jgi:hypothetical protein